MPQSAGFWANKGSSPKRKYRFLLRLPNVNASWTITKVNRPSFNITEATHSCLNHTFYFPGRVEWQTVTFTMVDAVTPDATAILMGILGAAGYNFPTTLDGEAYNTMSKAEAVQAMGEAQIVALDSNGANIDKWTLHNAWMKNVTMGDFDYTDDSLLSLDVELRYDYASYKIETKGASGLAAAIGSREPKSGGTGGLKKGYEKLTKI